MKEKRTKAWKYLKFFFPIPSVCIMIIFGITFIYGEIDGKRVGWFDWFGMMVIAFIFFIIPLDVVVWLLKKVLMFFNFKRNEKYIEKKEEYIPEPEPEPEPEPILTHKIEVSTSEPRIKLVVDYYFESAGRFVIEKGRASIGMIQREFKLGFNRSLRIMDQLEYAGIVEPEDGTKPRKVLMTAEEFQYFLSNHNLEYESFHINGNTDSTQDQESNIIKRMSMYNNKFDYMEGHDFEEYCAILLKNIGYHDVKVTKGSNDNGIDILATLGGVKYGIQCKCYSSDIGVKAIQEVYTGAKYYNCHVPVVLTNQHFTKQAIELAKITNVLLWDREYLTVLVNALEESNKINSN